MLGCLYKLLLISVFFLDNNAHEPKAFAEGKGISSKALVSSSIWPGTFFSTGASEDLPRPESASFKRPAFSTVHPSCNDGAALVLPLRAQEPQKCMALSRLPNVVDLWYTGRGSGTAVTSSSTARTNSSICTIMAVAAGTVGSSCSSYTRTPAQSSTTSRWAAASQEVAAWEKGQTAASRAVAAPGSSTSACGARSGDSSGHRPKGPCAGSPIRRSAQVACADTN